jgi:hypothetical protein
LKAKRKIFEFSQFVFTKVKDWHIARIVFAVAERFVERNRYFYQGSWICRLKVSNQATALLMKVTDLAIEVGYFIYCCSS